MAGPVIWSGADGKLIASGTMKDKRNIPYLQQPEKNYISMTGWGDSGGGLTVVETTTASELPREFTSPTGLKIAAGGGISVGDYVYKDFTLDDIDQNRKLNIKWAQKLLSTYAAGDLIVYIADQSSRATPLHTPLVSSIPGYDLDFDANGFDTTTTATLSLVIKNVSLSSGEGIVVSDVIVGPGVIQAVPAIGTWQEFTPSWSNISVGNGTSVARFQRVGDSMILEANLLFGTTTSVSGSMALFLPAGHTASLQATNFLQAGVVSAYDASNVAARQTGSVLVSGSILSVLFSYSGAGGGTWNATTPFTWATGDAIAVKAVIPIAEWAGAPNYAGQNDVEYAFNTSVTDAADTTSFGYGPSGTPLPSSAFTSRRDKRVRFLTPIQATDIILVQVDIAGTGRWLNIGDIAGAGVGSRNITSMIFQNSTYYGFGAFNTVNSTDIDVSFGRYAYPSGATYASAGADWSATTGVGRWRVVKAKAGAAVGFGKAQNGNLGLVTDYYQELDVSSSGDFSAAHPVIRISKTNNVVTMTFPTLAHTSSSGPSTATGVIPSGWRPNDQTIVMYAMSGTVVRSVTIQTTGQITFSYRDWAGTLSSQANTGSGGSVSWVVDQ